MVKTKTNALHVLFLFRFGSVFYCNKRSVSVLLIVQKIRGEGWKSMELKWMHNLVTPRGEEMRINMILFISSLQWVDLREKALAVLLRAFFPTFCTFFSIKAHTLADGNTFYLILNLFSYLPINYNLNISFLSIFL